jgi:hypothetical protein
MTVAVTGFKDLHPARACFHSVADCAGTGAGESRLAVEGLPPGQSARLRASAAIVSGESGRARPFRPRWWAHLVDAPRVPPEMSHESIDAPTVAWSIDGTFRAGIGDLSRMSRARPRPGRPGYFVETLKMSVLPKLSGHAASGHGAGNTLTPASSVC